MQKMHVVMFALTVCNEAALTFIDALVVHF